VQRSFRASPELPSVSRKHSEAGKTLLLENDLLIDLAAQKDISIIGR